MNEGAAAWRQTAVEAYARGEHEAAVAAFREALALAPGDARLHFEASVPHLALNQLDRALEQLTESLRLYPKNTDAQMNAALVSSKLGDTEGARHHLEAVLSLNPDHVQAANNLSVLKIRNGERQRALHLLEHAVACDPSHAPSRHNLAGLLHHLGRFQESEEQYRIILETDPGDETARFLLRALSGDPTAQRQPPPVAYVRSLFNNYAETFEADLVEKLGYAAPRDLCRMILAALGPGGRIGTCLDIGCGTGLAAPDLRPFTDTLVGVDLSPDMLAKAAARSQYDRLVEADGIDFMRENSGADLIFGADLLLYIGAPGPFLTAASDSLASEGFLALSTESASEEEADLVLRSSGRFAHRRDSFIEEAGRVGLTLITCEETDLRAGENGVQIPGDLFLFRKQVG